MGRNKIIYHTLGNNQPSDIMTARNNSGEGLEDQVERTHKAKENRNRKITVRGGRGVQTYIW